MYVNTFKLLDLPVSLDEITTKVKWHYLGTFEGTLTYVFVQIVRKLTEPKARDSTFMSCRIFMKLYRAPKIMADFGRNYDLVSKCVALFTEQSLHFESCRQARQATLDKLKNQLILTVKLE